MQRAVAASAEEAMYSPHAFNSLFEMLYAIKAVLPNRPVVILSISLFEMLDPWYSVVADTQDAFNSLFEMPYVIRSNVLVNATVIFQYLYLRCSIIIYIYMAGGTRYFQFSI